MKIVSHFFDKPIYADKFYSLQKSVFSRIDLKWALENGYLGDTVPFGLFSQDRALSIATVTHSDFLIRGNVMKAVQIGTVATDTEHLLRGYSARIMGAIIEQFADRTIFLYANDGVVDFYPRFGFRLKKESIYRKELSRGGEYRFSKLDLARPGDLALFIKRLKNRCVLSEHFCVADYSGLAEWYCRQFYADMLWADQNRETLLIAEEVEGLLSIYDIISDEFDPDFFEKLDWPDCQFAVCYFVPDRFNGIFLPQLDMTPDSHLFVRGDFPKGEKNIIPVLAHT